MKNRIVENSDEVLEIIAKCEVCYVSMIDIEGMPYVVPLNFGYENGVLYLHGAKEGKKIEALKHNPKVCVAFSTDHLLRYQHEQVACSWSMKYRSVLLYGEVEFINDEQERIEALNVMMRKYAKRDFKFNMPAVREVLPFKVVATKIEGRAYGY
ncbi:MAG: pyridoxamine 5'-phosphate oxidase family protein [Sphingobacteriia bacterium]|nr:pyridoxamine 5'-phosphate oxidase family protein [Sphingobacteriia bacterium]